VEWVLRKLRTQLALPGQTDATTEVRRIWDTAAAPGQAAQDVYELLLPGGQLSRDDPLMKRLLAAVPWRTEDTADR
jgi:hypothetical protein